MPSENAAEKSPRDRSPSFPFISLKAAVGRLEEFEKKFLRQEPTADRVYLAWGMSGDTSQSQQTLAALKSFGLLDYKGSGPKRPVAISEEGRKYLRAQQDAVKSEILKRFALKPKWMAHFWNIWGADKVPDEIRLDALVLEQKFNEKTAPTFLKVYDDTIAFAGLSGSDKITEDESENAAENQGDGNGDDDPNAGVGSSAKKKVKIMEGERVLTTGLLSKNANFRLIVTGEVGVKEIERLISKLELDKEILGDKDEDDLSDAPN